MRPNYFFNNSDDLVNHLLSKLPEEPGLLRLNLTLYFLFATYAAAYNPKVKNPNILDKQPRLVADLTFTADKYGPQDYSVNDKLRNEYSIEPSKMTLGSTLILTKIQKSCLKNK